MLERLGCDTSRSRVECDGVILCLNVGHMITKQLVTITSDKTILDAARMMVNNNTGLLVILNPGDPARLAGFPRETSSERWLRR
ncbi:MAG: CBS domain-containing protein [Candidatus Bathyarchaeia archaeon]